MRGNSVGVAGFPKIRSLRWLGLGIFVAASGSVAQAANIYWDGTGTSWNTASDWSTVNNATTPDPAFSPGLFDEAVFNITTVNTAQTVNLDAAHSPLGLVFGSTGTVLIQSGSGTNTLTLGANGITVNAGAGADTISSDVSSGVAQAWTNNASSTFTVSGNISNASSLLTIAGSGNTVLSGILGSGSGGLTKNGTGVLTLGGANTYTGLTTISSGTLMLGNAGALGSTAGSTTVNSGATLDLAGQTIGAEPLTISGTGVGGNGALVNSSATPATFAGTITNQSFTVGGSGVITLTGSINGTAALTKIGTGTLTLAGTTDNTGLSLAVNAGTVVLAKTSSHSPNDVHAVGWDAPLLGMVISGGTAQLGGTGGDQIYDSANVTVTSGAFDTNGRNEIFAKLSLQGTGIGNQGALVNTGFNTFSTITPTNGTVLTGNATIGVTIDSAITLNNAVSGNFALTKVGLGGLVLKGTNSFSGGLTVENGQLQVDTLNNAGTSGPLGNNTSVTLGSSGQTAILDYNGSSTSSNMPFVLAAGGTGEFYITTVGVNLTLNGVISGGGALRAGADGLTLGGSNTFTAGVIIDSVATLQLANPGALNASSPNAVTMNGGTLSLGGNSVTVSGLTSSSSSAVVQDGNSASATLTVNNSADNTFAGVLQNGSGGGTLALAKSGGGTLTLGGVNTFTGVVTINGGTLVLGNPTALGSTGGRTTVVSGATLDLGGQTIGAEQLTIQGAGVGGNGALINSSATAASFGGVVSVSGPLTVGGSGNITLSGSVNGSGNTLTTIGSGTLTLSGTTDNNNLPVAVNSGTVVLAKTSSGTPNDVHAVGIQGLTVNGGTAQLGGTGGDQIYDSGTVIVTSGAFDTNGLNETFAALSLQGTGVSGAGALVNSAGAASVLTPSSTSLTGNTTIGVTQAAGSLTLNNPVSGKFALTKVGLGTLIFSGNNTYTGTTTITQGALLVNGNHTGGDAYIVTIGGSLAGDGSTTAAVANNGGTISPGNPVGTLSIGSLTVSGGSRFRFDTGDLLAVAGGINLAGPSTVALNGLFPHPAFLMTYSTSLNGPASSLSVFGGGVGLGYTAVNDTFVHALAFTTTTLAHDGQISVTGEPSPDGDTFTLGLSAGAVNNTGQTIFFADMINPGPVRFDGTSFTILTLQNQPAPGTGLGNFSVFANYFDNINATGQVVFRSFLSNTTDGSTQGVFRADGTAVVSIARDQQVLPSGGGTVSGFGFASVARSMNDAGQVPVILMLTGAIDTAGSGVFRGDGVSLTPIARNKQTAPGAGAGAFNIFGPDNFSSDDPLINNAGQVAFLATLTGTTDGSTAGVFRGDGNSLTAIARTGQVSPVPGGGSYSGFDFSFAFNNSGQVAFVAGLAGAADHAGGGVFRGDGVLTLAMARDRGPAPGAGGGTFTNNFQFIAMNNAGQVAFFANLAASTDGGTGGVFRSDGTNLIAIARDKQLAPSAGGATLMLSGNSVALAIAPGGQVAFGATLAGTPDGLTTDVGLYIGDGQDLIPIAITGQSVVTSQGTRIVGATTRIGTLNAYGQIPWFTFFSGTGDSGNFLFTPVLHWRLGSSGNWDANTNWTLGLTPAFVHDVVIDPASSLTVTGPASNVTIKSLTVGGGSAAAALQLNAGALTVTGGVTITGEGSLGVDHVVMSGGSLTTPSIVVNSSGEFDLNGGTLTVNSGGTVSNFGTFDQTSGTLTVNGTFSNLGVATIGGSQTSSAGAIFTNAAGTAAFRSDAGSATAAPLTVNVNAGRVTFAVPEHLAALSISSTLPGGTLQIELASATSFGKAVVNGPLALGGTLNVSLVDGFSPVAGNTFDVLDWGTLSGTFSSLQLPSLTGGPLGWDTSQLYTTGTLSVVTTYLKGDWNRDGQVTATDIPAMLSALTDLNTYASNNSLSPTQLAAIGDFDNSGAVTNRDIQGLLDLVASQGGGSATAVPEPATLVLVLLAAAGWSLRRSRPRRKFQQLINA